MKQKVAISQVQAGDVDGAVRQAIGLAGGLEELITKIAADDPTGNTLRMVPAMLAETSTHLPEPHPLYDPRLTVVAQDAAELGRIATREVIRQIESRREEGRPPFQTVLPTRLIERETTGPPPVQARGGKAGIRAAEGAVR